MFASSSQPPGSYWWIFALVAAYFWWQVIALIHKRDLKESPWWVTLAVLINTTFAAFATFGIVTEAFKSIVASLGA